jgi:hypothetical protein
LRRLRCIRGLRCVFGFCCSRSGFNFRGLSRKFGKVHSLFVQILHNQRNPPVRRIERIIELAQFLVGETAHLRDLILPDAVQLQQPPRRIRAIGGERPIPVIASFRVRLVRLRQPWVGVVSVDVISYLKLAGSRQSSLPSLVSACGYMRNPTGAPFDPGRGTSCAKL